MKKQALADLLEKVLKAYVAASEHITDDLQQAFYDLEETGRLPWPWDTEPYDQAEAARRLATWWHGCGFDELVEEVEEALRAVRE